MKTTSVESGGEVLERRVSSGEFFEVPAEHAAPRDGAGERAQSRIRDARASAAGADRRSGRGRGHAGVQCRRRRAAPDADDICRQRSGDAGRRRRRGRKAHGRLPARGAARGHSCAVVGPRRSDGRQYPGRDLRRARKPRRLFPATNRTCRATTRSATSATASPSGRARPKRGPCAAPTKRARTARSPSSRAPRRSRPIASTSTTSRARARSIP